MISYKKLWKLLIDRGMKKQEFRALTKISTSSMSKMAHGQNINTNIILRICEALNCNISDIMEYVPEEEKLEK